MPTSYVHVHVAQPLYSILFYKYHACLNIACWYCISQNQFDDTLWLDSGRVIFHTISVAGFQSLFINDRNHILSGQTVGRLTVDYSLHNIIVQADRFCLAIKTTVDDM